ncbi:MAG: cob(I)yrinic acid a,c-diamide adenosyltransferase [Saprospiraceae bacterium]|nr:cob(I)yrinic acid a,c-diamide adenosyltransferase [Saprospiraceae bacterium]
MKVYTKTGDKGMTALFGGKRVAKDNLQIEAYGTVDELNAFLGSLISYIDEVEILKELKPIQSTLFDIGAHLASDGKATDYLPEIKEDLIQKLEASMDNMTKSLPELKNFIMPGGNQRISAAHICRTVCRRTERRVVALQQELPIPQIIIVYLNRLSDYFFVLSRYLCVLDNIDEVKWNPK